MDLDMKILLADDSSTMRRITIKILNELGLRNVFEAKDGSVALEVLRKEKVDLIIADWNMPKMNGLELLKAVRGDKKLKEMPFIILSAEGMKDNLAEAAEAGVDGYITKPFSPENLGEKIKDIFKKQVPF